MLAFWLGGVVCYMGFVLSDRESSPPDLGDLFSALIWPLTLTITVVADNVKV